MKSVNSFTGALRYMAVFSVEENCVVEINIGETYVDS
jgi:hypothetical protein